MKKSNIAIMAAVAVVIIVILAAIFIWNGNKNGGGDDSVSVTGIDIKESSMTIEEGSTSTISYTIFPSNATNKAVTWTSDKKEVATVKDGRVTGVLAGTAKITVKTNDGGFSDSINVTVTASKVAVLGVILDKTSIDMEVGSTSTIKATVQPTNASDKTVTWSSNDEKIATVDNGTVHAISAGTAVITVKTNDGDKTATCSVNVTAASSGYAPTDYVNDFLAKYDGSFGNFKIVETGDNYVALASEGNPKSLIDGIDPSELRESNILVYGYDSEAAAKTAFNEFLVNSKNGSKGETALTQIDKVGMASNFATVKDYRTSGASEFGADAAYILYGSYYKAATSGYTQAIGAIQDGDKVIVFNETKDCDLYCSLPIQDSSYTGADCISQADYEQKLMNFTRSFCDPSYVPDVPVPVPSAPVAYVESFLSKYDGFFGDFEITDTTDNCVTLATDGNLRTRISGAAEPDKTRETTIYVYGYPSSLDASAAFADFLANSKNGSKGETALTQIDKVGMASNFATVKDYRTAGASAFGADAAYFLYGSYYKETNNGYVQCIGAIQDGDKVIVFNRTIDNDLYCNLPIQDINYAGSDCVSQAYYEDELMKFARAFCDPTFVPEISTLDDAVLKVFGNADGNMVIDKYDINVIKAYSGSAVNDSNRMADANNDGKIDADDVAVVKKIIAREPTPIWHINYHDQDGNGTMDEILAETQFPINSIIMTGSSNSFMLMWMLGITEEIKGASYSATSVDKYFSYYLDTTKVEKLGTSSTTIAFENGAVGSSNIIAEKGVTALFSDWNRSYITNWQDYENAGIDVVRVGAAAVEMDTFAHSALLVGLLLDRVDRSVDLVRFYESAYDQINTLLAGLSDADKVPFIASSTTGSVSVGNSDYNNVGRLAGGVYALEGMEAGSSASIKVADYPQVFNTTLYNFDYILHLRTGSFYDGSEDYDKKWADYTAPFADWVNGTEGQYIICGGMPVPIRVAYAAEILHPELVPEGFADGLHQQLVDRFFNGDSLDISSMTFVIHK